MLRFLGRCSLFLVLFLALVGQYVLGGAARGCVGSVKSEYATPMLTGFWLGTAAMLAVTFFVLGCVFAAFELGAIKTLGAFYIVRLINPSFLCPLAYPSLPSGPCCARTLSPPVA